MVNRVTSSDGTSIAFERAGAGRRWSWSTPPAATGTSVPCGRRSSCCPGTSPSTSTTAAAAAPWRHPAVRGRARGGRPGRAHRRGRRVGLLYAMSSGGLLALHAAASGLAIPKLALFEPPIEPNETPTGETEFTAELAELVAAGRRRDAVELFHRGIGVPEEVMAQMTPAVWAALEAVAPHSSTTAGSRTPCRSSSSAP